MQQYCRRKGLRTCSVIADQCDSSRLVRSADLPNLNPNVLYLMGYESVQGRGSHADSLPDGVPSGDSTAGPTSD